MQILYPIRETLGSWVDPQQNTHTDYFSTVKYDFMYSFVFFFSLYSQLAFFFQYWGLNPGLLAC
jgi:hypothetical protein